MILVPKISGLSQYQFKLLVLLAIGRRFSVVLSCGPHLFQIFNVLDNYTTIIKKSGFLKKQKNSIKRETDKIQFLLVKQDNQDLAQIISNSVLHFAVKKSVTLRAYVYDNK